MEYKICIKEYKYNLCKVSKKYNESITCSKNWKYNTCTSKKILSIYDKKILYKLYKKKGKICRL